MSEALINEIATTIHRLCTLTDTSAYDVLDALKGVCLSEEEKGSVLARMVELDGHLV